MVKIIGNPVIVSVDFGADSARARRMSADNLPNVNSDGLSNAVSNVSHALEGNFTRMRLFAA